MSSTSAATCSLSRLINIRDQIQCKNTSAYLCGDEQLFAGQRKALNRGATGLFAEELIRYNVPSGEDGLRHYVLCIHFGVVDVPVSRNIKAVSISQCCCQDACHQSGFVRRATNSGLWDSKDASHLKPALKASWMFLTS